MSIASMVSSTVNSVANSAASTAPASNPSSASSPSSPSAAGAATSAQSALQSSTAAIASKTVSKDEFLKLLVAQLEHQDPLQPQDSTAFVTQLAQFSALEQQTETNTQLQSLTAAQTSSQRVAMANLVGHTAIAKASSISVSPGVPAPAVTVHLGSQAADVQVSVTDASGKVVRTIKLGQRGAGDVDAGWGGIDDKGRTLPPGNYNLKVSATAAGGASVDAYTAVSGLVTSIDFGSGTTQLRVGGAPISPSDILSIQR